MRGNKIEYDLVCSLGANCSAAFQLRYRNLRKVSLPFDWTWFNSEKLYIKLQKDVKNAKTM